MNDYAGGAQGRNSAAGSGSCPTAACKPPRYCKADLCGNVFKKPCGHNTAGIFRYVGMISV